MLTHCALINPNVYSHPHTLTTLRQATLSPRTTGVHVRHKLVLEVLVGAVGQHGETDDGEELDEVR